MADSATMLSRFRATLVGAVVGDCIGANFEDRWLPFVPWNDIKKVLQHMESLSPGDDELPFTDDTAMTRSVASSLTEHGAFHSRDMAERFTSEYFREPGRGYGRAVTVVFKKLKESNFSDVYKPASEQFNGSGSYGNGGAMRISPVALFAKKYNSFEVLKDVCEKTTKLTHSNKNGILGAVLQASAVDLALSNQGPPADLNVDHFVDKLIARIQPLENEATEKSETMQPYTDKLLKMKEFLKTGKSNSEQIAEDLGNDVSALDSVPTAIYSFLRAQESIEGLPVKVPFERAVLYAITMGGDTDTIASMTGAIAGALYGLENIPTTWQIFCEGVPDAIKQADELFKLYKKAEGQSGSTA
ncbi:ADP-ribosylhydrolase ARH3-like [Liolophura sinensis]|uniref:ADP-ribosylhydrolase ARH3-like n=1 Tax=Liolophura sinensis TaxID=3198878 RepID=UPI0031589D1A